MMAVEQRQSWIIGDEIDLDGAESRHIDRVFHHARGRLVAHLVQSQDAGRFALEPRDLNVANRA